MPSVVYNAGPCTCRPGRYVRFVVHATPGCPGVISCRGVDSPQLDVREHPIPADAEVLIHVPEFAR